MGDHKQTAFSQKFAQENPIYKFEFDGKPFVLVYDAAHDIVTLFSRMIDGNEISFETIDFRGQTETVRLNQESLHNGIYWMVWAHWFPNL